LQAPCIAQVLYEDDFEGGLSGWEVNNVKAVKTIESHDPKQGKVLLLMPNGNVTALIKGSDKWGSVRVEGKMLFPKSEHNYLGFIYNHRRRGEREDFGMLYVKGNDSYIRVNPWRDGNVSRLLYEEYKTDLEGDQAIIIGEWHRFKMEVHQETCHLYVNDMYKPKITFKLFELSSGKVGFQPRVAGGGVWIDDIKVTAIDQPDYSITHIPPIIYRPDTLITHWEVAGPFTHPQTVIERSVFSDATTVIGDSHSITWNGFDTDARGAIISGRVTEYLGPRTVAYFRTSLMAEQDKTVTLHFTTTDELTLYLNGVDTGRIYRDGYHSKDNDWYAWYDFWENPEHKGRKRKVRLKKGLNHLVVRVRNGQFASGGFFLHLEE